MATRDEVEAAVREYRAAKARLAEARANRGPAMLARRAAADADDAAWQDIRGTTLAVEGILDGDADPAAVLAHAAAYQSHEAVKARRRDAMDAEDAAVEALHRAEAEVEVARGRVFQLLAAYTPDPSQAPG